MRLLGAVCIMSEIGARLVRVLKRKQAPRIQDDREFVAGGRTDGISKPPGSGRGYESLVPIQAKWKSSLRPRHKQTDWKCVLG